MPRLSFSTKVPSLQIAWDSTSIGALKHCPRYYYYSIICGYTPRDVSVHLTFGIYYHSSLEAYDNAIAQGADHTQALRHAVRTALKLSWNSAANRPCQFDHKYKNRWTLVRSIAWYLGHFKEDTVQTLHLANGKAAVELSFRLELEHQAYTGEEFILCGHIDRLAQWQGGDWIVDRKTTMYGLDENYFARYTPDNQFSTYAYAGRIVYSRPVKGLIVDAAQILIEGTRFRREMVLRSQEQLEEWRTDLDWWINIAQSCAKDDYWPMNDKSCMMYGRCPFHQICSKSPIVRKEWLDAQYKIRTWDPLVVRGDV